MMKGIKYFAALVVILAIGYNSVYFQKLSEVKAGTLNAKVNIEEYSRNFWDNKLLPSLDKAIEINALILLLKTDPEKAFKAHAHAIGIGNLQYFMVRGEGQISSVNENEVAVNVNGPHNQKVKIATEYVYGNAVRDASGLLNTNEFDKTAEFNEVSECLNRIIRAEVLPAFKKSAAKNDTVHFIGAIELNKKFLNLSDIEVVPVQLKVVKAP